MVWRPKMGRAQRNTEKRGRGQEERREEDEERATTLEKGSKSRAKELSFRGWDYLSTFLFLIQTEASIMSHTV